MPIRVYKIFKVNLSDKPLKNALSMRSILKRIYLFLGLFGKLRDFLNLSSCPSITSFSFTN